VETGEPYLGVFTGGERSAGTLGASRSEGGNVPPKRGAKQGTAGIEDLA